jgi:hypothetical protein
MMIKLSATVKNLLRFRTIVLQHPQLTGKVKILEDTIAGYEFGWPPGHFYSPIPDLEKIKAREDLIWNDPPRQLAGVELHEASQLKLIGEFTSYYQQLPWQDEKIPELQFYYNNPNFSYGEAVMLYSMIRHLQPKKIIEIGSGYSSCVSMDTNQLFFNNSIQLTFVEPYPELLQSLLDTSAQNNVSIIASDLQNVPLAMYTSLAAGDILFIDSTHISKVDSDVNFIIFQILPLIRPGVYIHFHDIYYPFEYPKQWVYEGRAWNEAYLLRAFLQHNTEFEIVLFNAFLGKFYRDELERQLPLAAKNPGSSIWIKKR